MEEIIARIEKLERRLENFIPVVVMLRLGDGNIHAVTLFAQIEKPKTPTFEVVG